MKIQAGIDIGSVTTKCVIVKGDEVLSKALTNTGTDTEKAGQLVFSESLEKGNIKETEIATIISTGYGRRQFKKADKVITEIAAVGSGAFYFIRGKGCLVIDVGGQDTKIVEINNGGEVVDFLMNDKCAAGTGRFLELMASVLETDLAGFSGLALQAKNPVKINSTCGVFAESEVVSLLAHAAKKEDIAAGLINAIANRISAMINQFGKSDGIAFCGGGAKSLALKKALEGIINREIFVLENPQYVAALGAALKM